MFTAQKSTAKALKTLGIDPESIEPRHILSAIAADTSAPAAAMVAAQRGESVLSIAISCVGRRLVMGQRAEEETEAVLDALPSQTKQVGFYSYGEISPFTPHAACELHNQTMTITTLSER